MFSFVLLMASTIIIITAAAATHIDGVTLVVLPLTCASDSLVTRMYRTAMMHIAAVTERCAAAAQ